ncbi:hypothetical protein [Natrinema caseinilyticum]|uniref:hypothetical protein n=1 Tax=Natrinema caseinilyticum TaxID=2961570 RepID=UPI0020C40E19|nr:hypothetical protein [Natrinema caseinilyticum]
MVTGHTERAQVILIGAIALAFIILVVVVVFNGVLYTETLSSGGTSQSASNAHVVEYEVEQSVGCLLENVDEESSATGTTLADYAEENITALSNSYRNTTLESTATAVTISTNDVSKSGGTLEANITIAYDSAGISSERTRTVEAGCL